MYEETRGFRPPNYTRKFDPHTAFSNDFDSNFETQNYYQETIPRNAHMNNFASTNPERPNLFNARIKFTPKFFDSDMFQKKYKGSQTILHTKAQLPQLSVAQPLRAKIQKNISQPTKKDSYVFVTKQTGEYSSDKRFIIDEISYSMEEAIEENYYNDNKYPVLLVTSPPNDYDSGFDLQNEIDLIDNLCRNCRDGSVSLLSSEDLYHKRNTDFSVSNPELGFDHRDVQALQSSDLLYLNMFRIFTFIVRSSNTNSSKFVIHRLLYFPNVSFRMSLIHQPFKLVSTPLANLLIKKNKFESMNMGDNEKPEIKFGFVSLDANHRLLPIAVSDPLATQIPLIGIWIYGINPQVELLEDDSPEKRILQGILFEYINNTTLEKRYSFDKMRKMFLLALFSPEDGYKFYETEFMETVENQEIDNKWLMLKSSRETLNLNDAIDYLERNFILSPESVVRDLSSLKRDLTEQVLQSNVREPISGTRRVNNNSSLSNYLFGNPQPQQAKDSFLHGNGDELDSFDIDQQPPNPQPLPQPQPHINHQLEESQKTAYFVPKSEQTFAEESQSSRSKGFNVLPDSVKKQNPASGYMSGPAPSSLAAEKLTPFAEQLLSQQAKHMEFLQEEIRHLRNLVTNFQNNAALQQKKPEMVSKEVQVGPGLIRGVEEQPEKVELEYPKVDRYAGARGGDEFPRQYEPITSNAYRRSENREVNVEEYRKPSMPEPAFKPVDEFAKPYEPNAYRRAEMREQYVEDYRRAPEVKEISYPKPTYNEPSRSFPREEYYNQYDSNKNTVRMEPTSPVMNIENNPQPQFGYSQFDREPNFGYHLSSNPLHSERPPQYINEPNVPNVEKRVLTDVTNDTKGYEPRTDTRDTKPTPSFTVEYQPQVENIQPNIPKLPSGQNLSTRPPLYIRNDDTFEVNKDVVKTQVDEEPLKQRIEEPKKSVTFNVPEEKKPSGFTVLPPIDDRNNSIKVPQSKIVDIGGDSDSDDEEIKRIQQRYAARKKV